MFKLPYSSLEIVQNIIKGYSLVQSDKAVALPEISKKTGIDRTMISRNNSFLTELGIIEGASQKRISENGKTLGLALTANYPAEIEKAWKIIIDSNTFFNDLKEFVKIKGSVSKAELLKHISFSSGDTKGTAKPIYEILLLTNSIREQDGSITLTTPPSNLPVAPIEQKNDGLKLDNNDSHNPKSESSQPLHYSPNDVSESSDTKEIVLSVKIEITSANELNDMKDSLIELINALKK